MVFLDNNVLLCAFAPLREISFLFFADGPKYFFTQRRKFMYLKQIDVHFSELEKALKIWINSRSILQVMSENM